jgi:hypothetical protein
MLLAVVATIAALQAPVAAAASRAQLRFLSFAIRDQAPSIDEAKAFRGGEVTVEALVDQWLASPAHSSRIQRYFRDLFGVAEDVDVMQSAFLLDATEDDGRFYRQRQDQAPCAAEASVATEAWWLEPGETVQVCPSEISTTLTYSDGGTQVACTSDKAWWNACGCGPKLVGCMPKDLWESLLDDVREEFPRRAAHVYEQDGTWFDVFAGDTFYGDRILYWKYLHASKMARGGVLPSDAEMATLASLPMGTPADAPFPEGAVRAGLVTAPGFLLQHNNFRVRIRALTEKLLCQSIGPALNTSGISTFLNPDFAPEDLSHANQEQCARCHYPMDNLGSLLMGWDTLGEWNAAGTAPSQIGHAFGVDGDGPRFLARSFVERGPGFVSCMARTAWEDFSGTHWDDLGETDRQGLVALAGRGPRALIQTLLRSTLLANLGIESEAAPPAPVGTVPWSEAGLIVQRSCSGATCHSSGSFNTTYVDNEKNARDHAANIAERISATDGRKMPPPTSGKKLTAEEIATILGFLGR